MNRGYTAVAVLIIRGVHLCPQSMPPVTSALVCASTALPLLSPGVYLAVHIAHPEGDIIVTSSSPTFSGTATFSGALGFGIVNNIVGSPWSVTVTTELYEAFDETDGVIKNDMFVRVNSVHAGRQRTFLHYINNQSAACNLLIGRRVTANSELQTEVDQHAPVDVLLQGPLALALVESTGRVRAACPRWHDTALGTMIYIGSDFNVTAQTDVWASAAAPVARMASVVVATSDVTTTATYSTENRPIVTATPRGARVLGEEIGLSPDLYTDEDDAVLAHVRLLGSFWECGAWSVNETLTIVPIHAGAGPLGVLDNPLCDGAPVYLPSRSDVTFDSACDHVIQDPSETTRVWCSRSNRVLSVVDEVGTVVHECDGRLTMHAVQPCGAAIVCVEPNLVLTYKLEGGAAVAYHNWTYSGTYGPDWWVFPTDTRWSCMDGWRFFGVLDRALMMYRPGAAGVEFVGPHDIFGMSYDPTRLAPTATTFAATWAHVLNNVVAQTAPVVLTYGSCVDVVCTLRVVTATVLPDTLSGMTEAHASVVVPVTTFRGARVWIFQATDTADPAPATTTTTTTSTVATRTTTTTATTVTTVTTVTTATTATTVTTVTTATTATTATSTITTATTATATTTFTGTATTVTATTATLTTTTVTATTVTATTTPAPRYSPAAQHVPSVHYNKDSGYVLVITTASSVTRGYVTSSGTSWNVAHDANVTTVHSAGQFFAVATPTKTWIYNAESIVRSTMNTETNLACRSGGSTTITTSVGHAVYEIGGNNIYAQQYTSNRNGLLMVGFFRNTTSGAIVSMWRSSNTTRWSVDGIQTFCDDTGTAEMASVSRLHIAFGSSDTDSWCNYFELAGPIAQVNPYLPATGETTCRAGDTVSVAGACVATILPVIGEDTMYDLDLASFCDATDAPVLGSIGRPSVVNHTRQFLDGHECPSVHDSVPAAKPVDILLAYTDTRVLRRVFPWCVYPARSQSAYIASPPAPEALPAVVGGIRVLGTPPPPPPPEFCDPATHYRLDGVCTRATSCAGDEYETRALSTGEDRVCAPLTVCTSRMYAQVAETATTDRTCALITGCMPDEHVTVPASPSSDTACRAKVLACSEGFYVNASASVDAVDAPVDGLQCVPCSAGTTTYHPDCAVSVGCPAHHNMTSCVSTANYTCPSNHYLNGSGVGHPSKWCRPCKTCRLALVPCTSTSDAECAYQAPAPNGNVCPLGTYRDDSIPGQRGICRACTRGCPSVKKECTPTHDTVCEDNPVDQQILEMFITFQSLVFAGTAYTRIPYRRMLQHLLRRANH